MEVARRDLRGVLRYPTHIIMFYQWEQFLRCLRHGITGLVKLQV